MKRKHKNKLEKICSYIPKVDSDGNSFIPYCTYHRHRGIILRKIYKRCEAKECYHYERVYVRFAKTKHLNT